MVLYVEILIIINLSDSSIFTIIIQNGNSFKIILKDRIIKKLKIIIKGYETSEYYDDCMLDMSRLRVSTVGVHG